MATIQEQNTKTLREALTVYCGIDETKDKPTATYATNDMTVYRVNAKVEDVLPRVILMDFAGGGFYNDGNAKPITTEELYDNYTGQYTGKYGFISSSLALPGNFAPNMEVRIDAEKEYDTITIILSDSKGNNKSFTVDNPTWSNGRATVNVRNLTSWPAGERLHVMRVVLGKSWSFDNSKLISCTLNLRGVETQVEDPELQLSEIEIKAYENEDLTDVIGRMTAGAPIWYQAGYPSDMSELRYFYLNQPLDYKDNVLTIRGYDASYQLEGQYEGLYITSNLGTVRYDYVGILDDIIVDAGIEYGYDEAPEYREGMADNGGLFIPNESKRKIIANACNVYRLDDFCITYVDAGRPMFYSRPITTTWDIYANQVANFKAEIELDVTTIKAVLKSAKYNTAYEDIQQIDVVSGQSYFINTGDPYYSFTTTSGTITQLSPFTAKLTATTTTTATVRGQKINISTITANDPYTTTNNKTGITVDLEDNPLMVSYWGQDTRNGIDKMLDRSNIRYSFTYRGNPHIQPRDNIIFHYANNTTEQMTVESLTLEHQNGGFVSDIVARKGVV